MLNHAFPLWLCCCLALLLAGASRTQAAETFRPIQVKDGVFQYPDGSEVALFGTNYLPMSWYQYQNMKALKTDFRAAIRRDVAEMKRMGVQVVRVHIFDREHSDAQGNLVENEHLQILDMLIDELHQQGVYFYLTTLCWWNSPVQRGDAFGMQVTKMGMIFQPAAVAAADRFIGELLTHKNRYTGRALKDEPALAAIEIFNEPWYFPYEAMADQKKDHEWHRGNDTPPAVYQRDYDTWKGMWEAWCKQHMAAPTAESYATFQQEIVGGYYQRMIQAVKRAGAQQPTALALFETTYNPGVLAAIAASEADAVTDGWYPGGFGFNEEKNLFKEAENYELPPPVRGKAKMVYEFDTPGTYYNVGMYPAMARRYRSMGAQIVCQFQYDSCANAMYNTDWGVHYLNDLYTPAKAVAFRIASRAFSQIPRGTQFETPADRQVFGPFAVSFAPKQAMMVTSDTLMYANPIADWTPIALPTQPRLIVGRGDSPLITYNGSGYYQLEQIGENELRLMVSPDVQHGPINKEFFDVVSLSKAVVKLDMTVPRTLVLKLTGWSEFTCIGHDGKARAISGGKVDLTPGRIFTLKR